jgi:shikimate kinase
MRIFLAGVSCVGKTTIGAQLAGLLECGFFDLDIEIERFFETTNAFETVTSRRTISGSRRHKP